MKLLRYLWTNEDGFFGIGMGPSQAEYQQYGGMGNIADFSTSTGEGDVSAASDFWKAIISGDQGQLSRVLGPAYSNISKRGGQELSTLDQFSTRSGGTAAAGQQIGDEMRRESTSLEGGLLGSAASNLGSMGTGLLNTGLSAHEAAFSAAKTIKEQKQAKMNDIFKSIGTVLAAVAPFAGPAAGMALGAVGGSMKGGGGAGLVNDTGTDWADMGGGGDANSAGSQTAGGVPEYGS